MLKKPPLQVRVGVVQYSSAPRLEVSLDSHHTREGLVKHLKKIPYRYYVCACVCVCISVCVCVYVCDSIYVGLCMCVSVRVFVSCGCTQWRADSP